MKRLIEYWNYSLINKINIIIFILKLPFFILHELSHILVNIIFAKRFELEWKFLEYVDSEIVIVQLCIDVEGENDFGTALSAIIPNIIYYGLLIFSFIEFSQDMNIEKLLIYIYIVSGVNIATSSKEDVKIYKDYLKKKYRCILRKDYFKKYNYELFERNRRKNR